MVGGPLPRTEKNGPRRDMRMTGFLVTGLRCGPYHPLQNHYTYDISIFELCRGLQLQLSGVFRINSHYSDSFLVFIAEWSYRK